MPQDHDRDRLTQLLAINDQLVAELTRILAQSQNDVSLEAARQGLEAALKIKIVVEAGITELDTTPPSHT